MASRGNLWTGHAFWHAPPGLWIRSCFYATEYLTAENRILRAQVLRRDGFDSIARSSRRRRAASIRIASTALAGVRPCVLV
jgi:hypothetical protein